MLLTDYIASRFDTTLGCETNLPPDFWKHVLDFYVFTFYIV